MSRRIPITLEFNKSTTVGEIRLTDEVVRLLQTGKFKLEPGLLQEGNDWVLVELSIVKDNSIDRKQL